jgi:hypothetical protein
MALNLSEKLHLVVISVSCRQCWIHLSTLSEFAGPIQGTRCPAAHTCIRERRHVWLRGYVVQVVIAFGGDVIARHPRCRDSKDMVFDPVHYLPLLEHKIGTLDQAAPLAGWDLPEELKTLRRLK